MLSVTRASVVMLVLLAGSRLSFATSLVPLARETQIPVKVWEQRFGDEGLNYASSVLVSDEQDHLWIGGVVVPVGLQTSPGDLWLWEIEPLGRKVREIRIPAPQGTTTGVVERAHLAGFVPRADGQHLVVTEFERGRPLLVRLNENGGVAGTREITQDDVKLTKALAVGDGAFAMLGMRKGQAFAMAVAADGSTRWERTLHFESASMGLVTDGVVTGDAGLIVVGQAGQYTKLGYGPSTVFAIRISSKGEIVRQETLPGRNATIARGADGSYAVVFDNGERGEANFVLTFFDDDRPDPPRVLVTAFKLGFDPLSVVGVRDGFLLAGSIDQVLGIFRMGTLGLRAVLHRWSFLGDARLMVRSCKVTAIGDDAYILYDVSRFTQRGDPNTGVGLLKLRMN